MFVTAGGNMVKIWDITNGGKMLRSLSPHHKLVTSMCLADNGQSLVTGSLDRQVIFTWIISSAATLNYYIASFKSQISSIFGKMFNLFQVACFRCYYSGKNCIEYRNSIYSLD